MFPHLLANRTREHVEVAAQQQCLHGLADQVQVPLELGPGQRPVADPLPEGDEFTGSAASDR